MTPDVQILNHLCVLENAEKCATPSYARRLCVAARIVRGYSADGDSIGFGSPIRFDDLGVTAEQIAAVRTRRLGGSLNELDPRRFVDALDLLRVPVSVAEEALQIMRAVIEL